MRHRSALPLVALSLILIGCGRPSATRLNTVHTRSIEGGDLHFYTFDGSAGQVVRFGLHTDVANPHPRPDVALTVTTPSGDTHGTTSDRIQEPYVHRIEGRALPEDGRYVVVVTNRTDETRTYTLGLVEVAPATTITPTAAGVSLAGSLSLPYDIDRYGFTVDQPSVAKLLITHPDDSDLEVRVALHDPHGRRTVGPTGRVGARSTVHGPFSLPVGGPHVLEVEAVAGRHALETGMGSYGATLMLPPVAPLPLGANVSGRIENQGVATYRFETPDTDQMTVALLASTPDPGSKPAGHLLLMHGDGAFSERLVEGASAGAYASFGLVPTADGADTVVVETTTDEGFDYLLAVAPVVAVAAARPLRGARPRLGVAGSIAVVGEIVSYAFAGREGETVTLTLRHPSSAALRAEVHVYREATGGRRGPEIGHAETTAYARSDTLTFTVPATETLLLDVSAVAGPFETVDQVLGGFELALEVR